MEQPSFASLEFQNKKRKTRREAFLERMDALIPWKRLEERIRPHYPKAGRGRQPYDLSVMLRVHIVQVCYNLSDPGMEDLLYEAESVRRFVGLGLTGPLPDESTILHFRHLLERHNLGQGLFTEVKEYLAEQGVWLKEGTIVDATIIEAPSSAKNRSGQRDPEMRQVKNGNQYHFGMKLHIGTDAATGLVHSFTTTSANVHDVTQAHRLLHGGETQVWADAGYMGVQKREENLGLALAWQVALRPGRRRKLEPNSPEARAERTKASVRAKVEHPFLKVKGLLGYANSLPPSPIGGTLPGSGQDQRAVGVTAGPDQPDHRPTLPSHLTQGVVGPNLVRKHPGTQTQRQTGPRSPKTAKKRDPNPTKTSNARGYRLAASYSEFP